jgi:hypothetical protein
MDLKNDGDTFVIFTREENMSHEFPYLVKLPLCFVTEKNVNNM